MRSDKETVLEIVVTPEHTPRRRYRYHRRHSGGGYWRTEYEWTGCLWRVIDRQPICELSIRQEFDQ